MTVAGADQIELNGLVMVGMPIICRHGRRHAGYQCSTEEQKRARHDGLPWAAHHFLVQAKWVPEISRLNDEIE
jgi:hypothetical protein